MDPKKIQRMITGLDFENAYHALREEKYSFEFQNLAKDFPKVNSSVMYLFLMYAISRDESTEKHIAICNYLYFMDPYIRGADSMIRWHLLRALEISPNNQTVLRDWIFGVYDGNPDCPFTQEELAEFRKKLND